MTSPREQVDAEAFPVALRAEIDGTAWELEARWTEGAEHGPWELVIRPTQDATADDVAAGISHTVLRHIDFQQLAEHHRAGKGHAVSVRELEQSLAAALPAALRHGVTDEYLAYLALAYVTMVKVGRTGVTAALANMSGKQPETIRQHLKRARQAGMLTTVRGKAGGQLTDKANAILDALGDTLSPTSHAK